jgi:arylsulfatase
MFLFVPAQEIIAKWLETLKEFPIRQRPSSFSVDDVVQQLMPRAG